MSHFIPICDWLEQASKQLESSAHVDNAALDAQLLLTHVTGYSRTQVFTWPDKPIYAEHIDKLRALLVRRCSGEPIAYIIGHKAFYSVELKVTPAVLVPRPETELLVSKALDACTSHCAEHSQIKPTKANGELLPSATPQNQHDNLCVLDAGTGSGAIAIALAYELSELNCLSKVSITASDLSADALAVASHNAANTVPGQIAFVHSDWLAAFEPNSFHIIISNPPYIEDNDPHLSDANLMHEPSMALASGTDGLSAIRTLVKQSVSVGKSNALVLIEHGFNQAKAVQRIMRESAYTNVITYQDLQGLDRVTVGTCATKP